VNFKPAFAIIAILLSGPTLSANPTLLDIDTAHSAITVDVAASPFQDFTGHLQDFDTSVELAPSGKTVARAYCKFQFKDLKTGKQKRDEKMLDWLETETFPEALFVLQSVEDDNGQTVGVGTFKIHGITQRIRVPFTLETNGNTALLKGSAKINTRDYDLPIIRLFVFKVDPELTIHLELNGTFK